MLVRWAFPPETKVHDLAEALKLDFPSISMSEDGLLRVIGRHNEVGTDITWSTRCGAKTKRGGYACGLWSLLHILSIGVAERHASVVGDADERVTAHYAGEVMKSFIDNFFIGCDSCRESWIELYDEAVRNGSAMEVDKSDEWSNLAMWVWEVHNEITVLREQSLGQGYHREGRGSSSLWPSREDCPKCWEGLTDDTGLVMSMDSYNRKEVYEHLKKTYWPSGIHNNRLIVVNRWSKAKRALSMKRLRARMAAHDWSTTVLALHVGVVCLMIRILCGRRRKGRSHRDRKHVGAALNTGKSSGRNSSFLHPDRHGQTHPGYGQSSNCRKRSTNRPGDPEPRHCRIKMGPLTSHEGRRRRARPAPAVRDTNRFNYFMDL